MYIKYNYQNDNNYAFICLILSVLNNYDMIIVIQILFIVLFIVLCLFCFILNLSTNTFIFTYSNACKNKKKY